MGRVVSEQPAVVEFKAPCGCYADLLGRITATAFLCIHMHRQGDVISRVDAMTALGQSSGESQRSES